LQPFSGRDGSLHRRVRPWGHGAVALSPAAPSIKGGAGVIGHSVAAALPDESLDPARGDVVVCLLNGLLLTLAMRRDEIACLLAVERQPTIGETKGFCA
jgi:hypothetical protein